MLQRMEIVSLWVLVHEMTVRNILMRSLWKQLLLALSLRELLLLSQMLHGIHSRKPSVAVLILLLGYGRVRIIYCLVHLGQLFLNAYVKTPPRLLFKQVVRVFLRLTELPSVYLLQFLLVGHSGLRVSQFPLFGRVLKGWGRGFCRGLGLSAFVVGGFLILGQHFVSEREFLLLLDTPEQLSYLFRRNSIVLFKSIKRILTWRFAVLSSIWTILSFLI
jgi:hypothetical protein